MSERGPTYAELEAESTEARFNFHYGLHRAISAKVEALTERLDRLEPEVEAHSKGLSEAQKPWTEEVDFSAGAATTAEAAEAYKGDGA